MRLLTAITAIALLALPTAHASAQGAMPAPGCFGIQVNDKAGDSANSLEPSQTGSPSSDLIAGWIDYDAAAGKATANIQVDHLTEGEIDPPYVAIGWEMMMNTADGARYVRAYHDRTGITKYNWGEPRAITDDQTAPRAGGETTGQLFPGKGGVIQIDMPLAEMGAKPGSQLKSIALEVRQWISLPAAVPSTGLPLFSPAPIYDEATGKGAYTLGPCPAAPAPTEPAGPTPSEPASPSPGAQKAQLGITVKVPKLKAKKLRKGKRITIRLKGEATALKAVVRKRLTRGKNLAVGKLSKLDGSGKLRLKLKRKLKKGKYVLAVSGRNADGQPAEGAVSFRVR